MLRQPGSSQTDHGLAVGSVGVAPPPAGGWYRDPWNRAVWRWWDGLAWTHHESDRARRRPRLGSWLSWPIALAGLATVISLAGLLVVSTESAMQGILLGLVPLAVVLPVLTWLDRLEPEPLRSRLHAVLWGASVAGFVSGVVNSGVAYLFGESWAAVVSAPLIEEVTKGLGVLMAVRRREIDGVMDGIVYAGWVALGFAVVEDFLYLTTAAETGALVEVFVVRAILTPFAHPLFTAWIGLAVGLAVARQQPLGRNCAWGFGLAAASHAAWNGSLTYSAAAGREWALLVAVPGFIAMFLAAVVTVIRIHRHDHDEFNRLAPLLAERYGLTSREVAAFGSWQMVLNNRRNLLRKERERFDAVHAALARLALFHRRHGDRDPVDEQILAGRLAVARSAHLTAAKHGAIG